MYGSLESSYPLVLVEDSDDDERLSLRAIARSGVDCAVVVIRHGGEAISRLLASEGPAPSLIILDFQLPGSNGLEILRRIRHDKNLRFVPIVMFSSLGSESLVHDCMQAGANSFVQKPVDPVSYIDDLGSTVRYWTKVHLVAPFKGSRGSGSLRREEVDPNILRAIRPSLPGPSIAAPVAAAAVPGPVPAVLDTACGS